MGVYRGYFLHSAVLRRVLRNADGSNQLDAYGNPKYSTPINIRCFRTVETSPVRTEAGTVYVQKKAFYVDGSVLLSEGDTLDALRVDTLVKYYDIHGALQYYVATVQEV